MAADGPIANEKGDLLDLRTVIDSTPGLIHTSQPDGYLDFSNQTWIRYVRKPLEHLRFFGVPRSLLGAHLRAFAGGYDWVSLLPFFEKLETRNWKTALPSHHLLRFFGVSRSLHRDLGSSHIQLLQVFRR